MTMTTTPDGQQPGEFPADWVRLPQDDLEALAWKWLKPVKYDAGRGASVVAFNGGVYYAVTPGGEVDHEGGCCPTPQAAARNLCGCWGGPGQWIGSAD